MDSIPADAHTREIFYVGGEYVDDGTGNETLYGQVYVEHLVPVHKPLQPYPIVFIPGSSRTGIDFLRTPSLPTLDNSTQQSWSSHFLSLSHELYLIDPPFRGRSPWHPPSHLSSSSPSPAYLTFGAAPLQKAWTTPPASSQWPDPSPGKGSPAFDHVMKSTHPQLADLAEEQTVAQKSLSLLLDKIGKPVVLLAHSMGCKIAWLLADARPELVKAIVAVEPAGPAFQSRGMGGLRKEMTAFGLTEAPLTFYPAVGKMGERLKARLFPPPRDLGGNDTSKDKEMFECLLQDPEGPEGVRKLVNLTRVEVLVVTGEGSPHSRYDWGTVEFLRQAGVEKVEHFVLCEEGVMKGRVGGGGNGHMMMMERNRGDIVRLLGEWVAGR